MKKFTSFIASEKNGFIFFLMSFFGLYGFIIGFPISEFVIPGNWWLKTLTFVSLLTAICGTILYVCCDILLHFGSEQKDVKEKGIPYLLFTFFMSIGMIFGMTLLFKDEISKSSFWICLTVSALSMSLASIFFVRLKKKLNTD